MVKFHHLAWMTTVLIGVQMVLAGIIVGEDAGLVCPSWPACSTTGPIPVTSGLILEMVHRVAAMVLGVVVISLLIWLFKSYRNHRAMVWTGCLGLVSLLIQIVYAGMIVLFVFPGVASVVDVVNSVIMLTLFIHLANLATRDYRMKHSILTDKPDMKSQSLKRPAWFLYAAGMIAVAVGAIFRHTGAGQALFGEDSYIRSHDQLVPPSQTLSHALLSLHGASAALLVFAGVWFAGAALKHNRMMKMAASIIGLIIIQGGLGAFSLATQLNLIVVTMHWAMAGVIMGVAGYVLSKTYLAKESVVGLVETADKTVKTSYIRRQTS